MFNVSTEAMQPVLQSKLGKELDALWQEVIDYRDTKLKDMSFGGKLGAIRKFFHDTTAKKFVACVWKNVGLNIKEVKITNLEKGGFANASFFGDDKGNDQSGWFQIEEMLNGGYYQRVYAGLLEFDDKAIDAATLFKIAESFDSGRGVVRESVRTQMRNKFSCDIYFDIETGFLVEDKLPKNGGVNYFTAQEITAIILHELGHTLNLVEHAADMYARVSTFRHLEAAFKSVNIDNVDQVIELSEGTANLIEKKGDKVNADRLRKIAAQVKHDIRFAGGANRLPEQRKILGSIIYFSFVFIFSAINVTIDIINGGEPRYRRDPNDQKIKRGDVTTNWRMVAWNERHADAFTVQHGYGMFQVAALEKLGRYFDRYGLSKKAIDKINEAEALHKDLGFLQKAGLLLFAPMMANADYIIYPEGVKRFREILNQTIQNLKMYSTNPAYVTKYMKDIDVIMDKINNFNKTEDFVARVYYGYDLFLKFCSISSFIEWLVNGRVKRELEQVISDADSIGNNLLTYYGFKLQQIGSK